MKTTLFILFIIALIVTIGFWMQFKSKSTAILHIGNLRVKSSDNITIALTYTPQNPIFLLSEDWNVLGGTTIKHKTLHPEVKSLTDGTYSFAFHTTLNGPSKYQLTSLTINLTTDDTTTVSFHTKISHDASQQNQTGYIEGASQHENNGIPRLLHLQLNTTHARFIDQSKNEFYTFFEKDANGTLQLDQDNRPILLADSLPKLQNYLLRELNSDE